MRAPPKHPGFIAALTVANRLSDDELSASLADELARERSECDAHMAQIIRELRATIPYVSSVIFDPPHVVEQQAITAEKALCRLNDEGYDKGGLEYRIVAGAADDLRREHEAASALRSARLAVAQADPEDYWDRKRQLWRHGFGFRGGIGGLA